MLKHPLFPSILLIGFLFQGLSGSSQVMHHTSQFNFVKNQIKDRQAPYWEAYQKLLAYADTALRMDHHFAWTFPTLMKPKMNY